MANDLLFGDRASFAIEVGDVQIIEGWWLGSFRFWICGSAVGDWDDIIPLRASLEYMKQFCSERPNRNHALVHGLLAEAAIRSLHDGWYEADYFSDDKEVFSYRDRFHMDHIGMSAVLDKYAVVLVASSGAKDRLIWRCESNGEVRECRLEPGTVERVGGLYVREIGAVIGLDRASR